MFRNFKLREVHFRWIGIPILAFIMAMVMGREEHQTFFNKYLISLMFTAFFWNGGFMIFIYYRRKFPQIKQTPRRLLITFAALSVFLIIGDPLTCLASGLKDWQEISNLGFQINNTATNFIAALVVGSVYENAYFFQQWKNTIQLNEALKNQQIRTQFEVLQNQMSPHFLFNSLNTLTTLIAEDGKIAIEFTEKLSEVYRYILQNKEKEVVGLSEELEFARNYIFLLKIRYPENLKTKFEVDEKYLKRSIAPLTIQILLENAIKHNVISKAHPLFIEISMKGNNAIIVKNNLQKKKTIEKSTKTGLVNIKKRYEYFGQKNIAIETTKEEFSVMIPLLKVKHEREHLIVSDV